MRKDGRLSGVLHILLHLAEEPGTLTSEKLSRVMNTNPVVVRRIMGGLRERGYVRSEKGHGGGWTLSCDLGRVTLRDLHEALGSPELFAIGNRSCETRCLVEEAVNAALSAAIAEAEARLLSRFGEVTLAALSADFNERLAERGRVESISEAHS